MIDASLLLGSSGLGSGAHPGKLFFVKLLLLVFGNQFAFDAFCFLCNEILIVSGVKIQFSKRKLNDSRSNLIQEISIMRNDQQRSLIWRKVALKPLDRIKVKMIRRFIQNQEVRCLNQNLSQSDTFQLSAWERPDLLVPVADVKLRQNRLDVAFCSPCIFLIHLVFSIRISLGELFVFRIRPVCFQRLFVISDGLKNRSRPFKNGLDNRFWIVKFRHLLQIPDAILVGSD